MAMVRVISRRQALAGLGGVAAASILAACGGASTAPTATPAAKPTAAAVVPSLAPVVTGTSPPSASAAVPVINATTAAAGSAVAPTTAAGTAVVKRGGQLRILQLNDFLSMDPVFSNDPTARPCYDWLLTWRPNAQGQFGVQPMLAKSWDVKGNTIVFHLQDSVKFHDGSDLNADVVVWNIKRMIQNPKSQATVLQGLLDKNNPAQALDPMTVQVNMPRPSHSALTQFSDAISNTAIASKKAADDHGEDWLRSNAVGTGPFKFVSWTSGNQLTVTRNENYWRKGADGKPLPYADGATYRVIIELSTQFNEMRAGTSDFMANVPGNNVAAAKQITTARYVEAPTSGQKKQFLFNALQPPFKDNLPLRQAIQYAVDRDVLVKALDPALGVPLPYEFVPGSIGYDTSVPAYDFNLDKANVLMKQAGVQTPFDVQLLAINREQDSQQAQLLQAMLAKIGVKLNLNIVERTAWNAKVRTDHDFQMATRQGGVAVDPANDLLSTWSEGPSGFHRAHVPGLLDLLAQADASYDDAERQKLFVQAQQLMYESAWFGYMWFENGNYLLHKRIQNASPFWGTTLHEEEWWISE